MTSHNTGPHSSNLANKLDPRVDSDRDGSRNLGATQAPGGTHHTGTTGHHTTGTTGAGYGSTNAGPHSSNLANKADPRVDSDLDGSRNAGAAGYGAGTTGLGGAGHHTGTTGAGYGSTNAGPHSSNLANKADPRVDSDLDGSRNAGASTGHHTTGAGYGSTTGAGYGGSTTAGPHSSNLANKADPRVDSDRDGSRNLGATQAPGGTHHTGTTGHHTTGTTGAGYGSTNAGPHSSNLANKADPRVDSDRDGSRNAGAATGHHTTGAGYGSTNAGPHSSNLANKADPRVDSDRDGSRNAGAATGHHTTGTTGHHTTGTTGHHSGAAAGVGGLGAGAGAGTAGTGPAPHTAGPHKSDLLNKLDPRVDSDQDGSRTVGGNKTYT